MIVSRELSASASSPAASSARWAVSEPSIATRMSLNMRLACGLLGGRRRLVTGEARAEDLLVELADGGLRDLVDELDPLGNPPLRHALTEVLAHPVGVRVGAGPEDDARARALAPALVGDRDHGGLDHVRVGHHGVLEVHRGDPLTAGLDQVLGAIDELDVGVALELGDVAGAQPTVLRELLARVRVLVIGAGDPRAADLELAAAVGVDTELDQGEDAALHGAERVLLVVGELDVARRPRRRRKGARLRHAPALDERDPKALGEAPDH